MTSNSIDPEFSNPPNITEFSQNDNFFRKPPVFEKYSSLPRVSFSDFKDKTEFEHYISQFPQVVFIDIWDVFKHLKVRNKPGYDTIRLRVIAEIVCDYLGDDVGLMEVLWNTYDEDLAEVIMAELDISEYVAIMSTSFSTAMDVVNLISELIKSYLINTGYPIIENESIYKVGDEKKGIIGLQLRTYEELKENYGLDEDVDGVSGEF